MSNSIELNVIHQSDQWADVVLDMEAIVLLVFKQIDIAPDDGALSIVLADDAAVQGMNRDFRGKDKPTNVLSFPSDMDEEWGDIVLAYETIAREAQEQGKPLDDHFTHLLVHGVLHVLGYDHIEDDEAETMEALEVQILSQLAIENPYENK